MANCAILMFKVFVWSKKCQLYSDKNKYMQKHVTAINNKLKCISTQIFFSSFVVLQIST